MSIKLKKPELKIGKMKKERAASSASDTQGGIVFGAPSEYGINSGGGAGASSRFSVGGAGYGSGFSVGSSAGYGSGFSVGGVGFGVGDGMDAFDVNVRNEAAGINLLDKKKADSWWKRELPHEIATAAALMTFFAFMLGAADMLTTAPFLLTGILLYMVFVILEEKLDSKVKLLSAAGTAGILIVLAIVLRSYIGGGLGSIMNYVYEASEAEQAYIYNMFSISEEAESNPDIYIMAAVVWVSCLTAALGAMPPAAVRRFLGLGAAAFAFTAFAYYGLVPSALVVVLAVAAIMFVMARGGILSALPVLLAALLFLGAIVLIDPGENYGISAADENMRDRFALRSAYLQSERNLETPTENDEQIDDDREMNNGGDEDVDAEGSYKWIAPLIVMLLLIAAWAGFIYLLYRRYIRRRDANREGLDSEDIRTAIIAMFPYAVRWLGAYGVEVSGRSFASLVEPLRRDVSEQYSNYFSSMYVLWREAAYSEHDMDEEKKEAMNAFVSDTRDMVRNAMDWKGKLRTAIKYAL